MSSSVSRPMRSQVSPWDGRKLVYHQSGDLSEPVAFVRVDGQAEERSVGRVGREGADGDRVGGVESIVLHDDDRAGLTDGALAGRSGPDLAASRSSLQTERVDERLILGRMRAGRDNERLEGGLRRELRRSEVRNPDLDRTKSLGAEYGLAVSHEHTAPRRRCCGDGPCHGRYM